MPLVRRSQRPVSRGDQADVTTVPFSLRLPFERHRRHDSLDWNSSHQRWRCAGAWLTDLDEPPIEGTWEAAVAGIEQTVADHLVAEFRWDGPAPQPGGAHALY